MYVGWLYFSLEYLRILSGNFFFFNLLSFFSDGNLSLLSFLGVEKSRERVTMFQ